MDYRRHSELPPGFSSQPEMSSRSEKGRSFVSFICGIILCEMLLPFAVATHLRYDSFVNACETEQRCQALATTVDERT